MSAARPERTGAAQAALARLLLGATLSASDAEAAMSDLLEDSTPEAVAAGLLIALRLKGETVDEIAGVARALRRRLVPVRTPAGVVVDTCGTGGDGLRTLNISTAAAFVVAGAGVMVAKHGNRSVSSACGSADVVEALGVPLLDDPGALAAQLVRHRMAFLFAPHLHPALRRLGAVRRTLGVRTVLNLAGPLANPAGVRHQVVGVPDPNLAPALARVLGRLGVTRAWVVCGAEGMDELTTGGRNRIWEVEGEEVRDWTLDAASLGLSPAPPGALTGGDARTNAERIEALLAGEAGPDREAVLLNAAAALVVAGAAADLAAGLFSAAASIDGGGAQAVLDGLRRP